MLSASRKRSSGEGFGSGWGLLKEVGSQTSGPYPGLSPAHAQLAPLQESHV